MIGGGVSLNLTSLRTAGQSPPSVSSLVVEKMVQLGQEKSAGAASARVWRAGYYKSVMGSR